MLCLLIIHAKIYHMVRVSGRIPSPVHDPQEEAETIEPMVPEIPSAMNSTSMRFEFYRLPTSICD